MHVLQAIQYFSPMNYGWSNPHLFLCLDGNRYVVKFMSNPQGKRVLANELISYRLAKWLKLPVPRGEIIYVSQELIDSSPTLQYLGVEVGPHFGSYFIESKTKNLSKADISQVMNISKAADMILFDYWLNNNDRHLLRPEGENNVLLSKGVKTKLWLIDHANILAGPNWTVESISGHQNHIFTYWGELYERFVPYIDNANPFAQALNRIESLELWQIMESISIVPVEWGVADHEKLALSNYLNIRKKLLATFIQPLRVHFPVWESYFI